MFTGIIEEIGLITQLTRGSQAAKLTLSVSRKFNDLKIGASVSVNGICLTVTKIRRNNVEFDLSQETLKRSSVADWRIGDRVNLERALSLSTRLGGHLVSGHIDGVGEIRKRVKSDQSLELHVSIPSDLLRYLVPKGSIAIDGISLTVADIRDSLLVIAVIPQTVKTTTLEEKNVGDQVNLEVDLLSKYIERHLNFQANPGITDDTLLRSGFMPMGWIEN